MKKKIYVIGGGLIGGSFAIDMRKLFPKSTIIGIDKSEIHLQKALDLKLIDDFNINGDFVESQAFGYLAIRSLKGLPITFPQTTKCRKPCTGREVILN